MRSLSAPTLLLSTALFVACGGSDPGPGEQNEPIIDAGVDPADAALTDADRNPDAGVSDATVLDAEVPDLGPSYPTGWSTAGAMPNATGRWGARVALVPEDRRLILFGGNLYPEGGVSQELWAFDLETEAWSELSSMNEAPPGRYCHCTTYLPETREILIVGGRDGSGPLPPQAYVLDLDTLSWTELGGSLPTGVIGCSAVWMPELEGGRAVVFGGGGATGFDRTTWLYDPQSQTFEARTTLHAPPGRADPEAAYDPVKKRILVFGGGVRPVYPYEHRNDLWAFDGVDWTELTPAEPLPGPRRFSAGALDAEGRRWYVALGTRDEADYEDFWALDLDADQWVSLDTTDLPSPRGFAASVWDSASRSFLIFGGLHQPNYAARNDGWRFVPGD